MPSVTLAESAKLTQDMLIAGVIEATVSVNPIYNFLPFMEIEGNSLAYNRENVLGDVQYLGVGGTITAKGAATFTQVTTPLTTIIGDAEVNGLIQATRSNKTDQKGTQIASKAKSLGRQYQDGIINGTGASNAITGLISLVPAAQKVLLAASAFSLGTLDQLIDLIKDKDGNPDWFMMSSRSIRSYYAFLRAAGGATIGETITLPSGTQIPAYRGIPIFRNDYIPINGGAGTNESTLFCGTFDDGSGTHGISGLTAANNGGIQITEVGESETKDESITRIKMYAGFALFSELGIAAATGATN